MKKERYFPDIAFKETVIRLASDECVKIIRCEHSDCRKDSTHIVSAGHILWDYDSSEEFFAFYRRVDFSDDYYVHYGIRFSCKQQERRLDFELVGSSRGTRITVRAESAPDIEAVHSVFENASRKDCISLEREVFRDSPVVFIGHGRSKLWLQLKDHLQDRQGYRVEAYEMGARAGHAIRDILDSMLDRSSFALLVMTGEDEMADGRYQPRVNVVHELGLFQGRLGWLRAIMLLEEGAEDFSNMAGIEQIRFSEGNIKEVFGDVLATLRREFAS